MRRYMLTVAYDGTDFHGWQKQHPPPDVPDAEPLRTVQSVVEQAAREVVREPVTLTGASRTDSGVHARGQVAAFSADCMIDPQRMLRALNSRLPADVLIRDVREVPLEFNPIGDAEAKGYRYRIVHSGAAGMPRPLFTRRYVSFTMERLDAGRMFEAARHLIGEHDFASFTRVHHGRETTVREIFHCAVSKIGRNRVQIDVSGSGFLYHMVRIIAGTLHEVGRGKIEPHDLPTILEARDRSAAGPTLPPDGLCLMWVRYPGAAMSS